MDRGGGGARGGRGGQAQTTRQRTRGLFAEGIWMCNCTPRLPAEHFRVKKEGKNQGRWFYTCQQSEPKRCDFFLWDEDAKPREEAAVLSGKRTEPGEQEDRDTGRAQRAARTDGMGAKGGSVAGGRGLFGSSVQQVNRWNGVRPMPADENDDTESPTPSPSPSRRPSASTQSGVKRTAVDAGTNATDDDDDESFAWSLNRQEAQEMVHKADLASVTPQKAQNIGVYATPTTTGTKRKLPWLEPVNQADTPTPSKRLETVVPSADMHEHTPKANLLPTPVIATADTPFPATRFKDALQDPADSQSSLTKEALAALAPANLAGDVRERLRSILSKHDLKTQGILRGRDISRLALKAKDAKIAELETKIAGLENAQIAELHARIASLEAEREVDRGVIRQLKWRLEHGEDE